jgi:hypothetical protein
MDDNNTRLLPLGLKKYLESGIPVSDLGIRIPRWNRSTFLSLWIGKLSLRNFNIIF